MKLEPDRPFRAGPTTQREGPYHISRDFALYPSGAADPMGDYIPILNLIVKALDFIQFGGGIWMSIALAGGCWATLSRKAVLHEAPTPGLQIKRVFYWKAPVLVGPEIVC